MVSVFGYKTLRQILMLPNSNVKETLFAPQRPSLKLFRSPMWRYPNRTIQTDFTLFLHKSIFVNNFFILHATSIILLPNESSDLPGSKSEFYPVNISTRRWEKINYRDDVRNLLENRQSSNYCKNCKTHRILSNRTPNWSLLLVLSYSEFYPVKI